MKTTITVVVCKNVLKTNASPATGVHVASAWCGTPALKFKYGELFLLNAFIAFPR